MNLVSLEFCLTTILILLIFVINISQILFLIICKHDRHNRFFRSIIFNFSFSSLIVAIWLIPFFYFRTIWSADSISWRLWSFGFHTIDAVQLYSLLLLITNSSAIHLSLQRFLIGLSWFAPMLAYSPLLWLSSSFNSIDYMPYRRFSLDVPWWILPILYSSMYLVPILISLVLIGSTFCWPWIYRQYENRRKASRRQENEHQETMAELTSLIETVLNFELDQSTLNTWIPSISSINNTDHTSVSTISNPLTRSLSYKASQDHSSFLFDDLLSSEVNGIDKHQTSNDSRLLLIITCLLLFVHLPYIFFSLMDHPLSQLPMFIYIHWLGTIFIPIIHFRKH